MLTSFTERRTVRDEIRHYTALWQELCNCGGPQPGYADDLKLDEHFADCPYVEIIEQELENNEGLTPSVG